MQSSGLCGRSCWSSCCSNSCEEKPASFTRTVRVLLHEVRGDLAELAEGGLEILGGFAGDNIGVGQVGPLLGYTHRGIISRTLGNAKSISLYPSVRTVVCHPP